MRSKTSYFNPTLFKKDLARSWPLWGGASALGALAPLWMLVAYLNGAFGSLSGKGLEMTRIYYSVLAYAVPVISLFYAVLCALAVWHYLYSARSVGLFHALPITRKGLFVTDFLAGLCMMLIPYAVTGGLTVPITVAVGLFEPVGVLVTVLGIVGESFFYFAAATFIIFVTGNPFAYAALYFIFHFLACGAEYLAGWLMDLFYFGVNFSYKGVAAFLSPTVFFVENLRADWSYRSVPTAEGWTELELECVTLEGGWTIAAYALAGAALLGCAWLLYRRRRSESAGDVVAVGWMKPIFRYGVALCAALSGGVLLYLLFCKDFMRTETARPLPMAVCMAIAGVVGYYIASMLLAKSLAVFRRSGKGVLATVAAAAAVCLLISADPFGVERWVPEADGLETVGVSVSTNGGYAGFRLSDPAVLDKALDLHRTILAEKDLLDDRSTELWEERYAYGSYGYVSFIYRMDGKSVYRFYDLPVTEAALARLESLKKTAALVTDPAVQEANIFSQILASNVTSARLTGGYIGSVYDTADGEAGGAELTPEQARTLEAAIRRDIQEGHFGRTLLMPSYEERDRAVYAGEIQLYYSVAYKGEDPGYRDTLAIHLEISVYCTETVKALEEIGVLDGTHELLTAAEQSARWEGRERGASYAYGGEVF